jgi:hydrogenase nickel incorporation protein HypB
MLEVEIDVLDKNNRLAARNRARFAAKPAGAESGLQPRLRQNHPADETLLRLKGKPPAR